MSRYVRSFPVVLSSGGVSSANLPPDARFLGVIPPDPDQHGTAYVMFLSSTPNPAGDLRTFLAVALGAEIPDDPDLPILSVVGLTTTTQRYGLPPMPWAILEVGR